MPTIVHHVIYIPGLADHTIRNMGQDLLIRLWRRRYHIHAGYHLVGWSDQNGDFLEKKQELLDKIDSFTEQGHTVSLVASSAGASMALHAFAERRDSIHRVVLVCAALGSANTVVAEVYAANPAFKDALVQLPAAMDKLSTADRAKILSFTPLSDRVVPLKDMAIAGAQHQELPTNGHLWSIVAALSIYSRRLVEFIII